jgi:hypothetical protein
MKISAHTHARTKDRISDNYGNKQYNVTMDEIRVESNVNRQSVIRITDNSNNNQLALLKTI